MDSASLTQLGADALALALRLALPALGACLLAGVVVGFVQGATRAQDASLGFLPKLAAVSGALLLSRAFLGHELSVFCAQIFQHIAAVSR